MTLIVEDGTGLANAESYISVADATAYFSARGGGNGPVWAAYPLATQEAALRDATDYMVSLYRQRWTGYRANRTQALCWPRQIAVKPDQITGLGGGFGYGPGGALDFYLPTDIPVEVKTACADLALRAALAPLTPDIGRVKAEVKIGSIDVKYDPASPINTVFPAVNRKLAPLLTAGGNRTMAVRA